MSQTEGGRDANCGPRLASQQFAQLVAHDFDHLLIGRKLQQHFRAERFLADVRDEFVGHAQIHVGIEQRLANFAERRVEMLFGELALAAQVLECALKFFGKCFKHERPVGCGIPDPRNSRF